jgi:hypothetical protein
VVKVVAGGNEGDFDHEVFMERLSTGDSRLHNIVTHLKKTPEAR